MQKLPWSLGLPVRARFLGDSTLLLKSSGDAEFGFGSSSVIRVFPLRWGICDEDCDLVGNNLGGE